MNHQTHERTFMIMIIFMIMIMNEDHIDDQMMTQALMAAPWVIRFLDCSISRCGPYVVSRWPTYGSFPPGPAISRYLDFSISLCGLLLAYLVQNQDFDWRKISSFDETLQTDQIEGAEFEFLGPKTRFERNKRSKFLNVKMKILEPKSKIRQGHASSRDQKSHFPDS